MPIDYVKELVRLAALPRPREQPKDSDWRNVEAELGYKFPTDFKELVNRLGSGDFGCGVTLQNPCASIRHARICRESLILHREPIQDLEESLGISLYPSPGGVVLIASMDRQDFYLGPSNASSRSLDQLIWLDIDLEQVTKLTQLFPVYLRTSPRADSRSVG